MSDDTFVIFARLWFMELLEMRIQRATTILLHFCNFYLEKYAHCIIGNNINFCLNWKATSLIFLGAISWPLLSRIMSEVMSVKLGIRDKLIKKKKKNFLPRLSKRIVTFVQNVYYSLYSRSRTLNGS